MPGQTIEGEPAGPPSTDPLEAFATDLIARAAKGRSIHSLAERSSSNA